MKELEALAKSANKAETDQIVGVLNENAVALYISDECKTVLGWSSEELEGKCLFSFLKPDCVDGVKQDFQKMCHDKCHVEKSVFFAGKDGSWNDMYCIGEPLFDGVILRGFLITSRKRKRIQVEKVRRVLADTIDVPSHLCS